MIEKGEMTGALHRETPASPRPIWMSPMSSPTPTAQRGPTPMNDRYGSAKLYAQYLREGKMSPSSSKTGAQSRIDSARDSSSLDRHIKHGPDEGTLNF